MTVSLYCPHRPSWLHSRYTGRGLGILPIFPLLMCLYLLCISEAVCPNKAQAAAKDSVIKIVAARDGRKSQGTAFYVHPNILATSYHTIQGCPSITAYIGEFPVRISNLLAFEPNLDLALAYVPFQGTPLSLGNEDLEPMDRLQALGFAGGKSLQKVQVVFHSWAKINNIWHLNLQGQIQAGMSGGPVLDVKGQVVGMNSLRATADHFSRAVSVNGLRRVLNQALEASAFIDVAAFARRTRMGPKLTIEDNQVVITDE